MILEASSLTLKNSMGNYAPSGEVGKSSTGIIAASLAKISSIFPTKALI
jgi:hypothetical protein